MPSQDRYYSSTAVGASLTADVTNSASSLSLDSTSGFPTSFPYTLILEQDTANQEIVTVTAASGLNLTVTRGVDGSSALPHSNGAAVIHGVSARDFNEPQVHIAATSGVHGVTGTLVGTSDTQTLANKTLSSPVIDTPVLNNGGVLTLPTSADTLVGRATTDTLTNKTLTSPAVNGGTQTGVALDATSTIGGITGAQVAADHATTATLAAAVSAPLAGSLGSNKASNGTLFTIGSLAIGTWHITVPVLLFNTVNSSGVITATGASGITLTGVSAVTLNCSASEPVGTGTLSFLATVGTAGLVTVTLSALTGSGAAIEAGNTGYTAVRVA
jgi:hypothetical protein